MEEAISATPQQRRFIFKPVVVLSTLASALALLALSSVLLAKTAPPANKSTFAQLWSREVAQCLDKGAGVNYCSEWCNTHGKWGCSTASHDSYTCSCTGCNGCAGQKVDIRIGESNDGKNKRCVTHALPVTCAADAGNKNKRVNVHAAGDTFKIGVANETRICAQRTDSTGGWGMDLKINCVEVPKCLDHHDGHNYCSEWCNTHGKWGCGTGIHGDYNCACAGCNGC